MGSGYRTKLYMTAALYSRVKDFPVFLIGCLWWYCGGRWVHICHIWTGAWSSDHNKNNMRNRNEIARYDEPTVFIYFIITLKWNKTWFQIREILAAVSTCEGRKVSISNELSLHRCGRPLGDVGRSQRWQLWYTRVEVSGGTQLLCGCGCACGHLHSLLYVQLLDYLLSLQRLVWRVWTRRS